jgi:IS30 family transposase
MSYKHLNIEQRISIQTLLKEGLSKRQIAQRVKVSHNTVAVEIRRNSHNGSYTGCYAARQAALRRQAANQHFRVLSTDEKLSNHNTALTRYVVAKLKLNWSPEQIAGRLRVTRGIRIAVQTIYDWIYLFRKDLRVHLHHIKGKYRKSRETLLNKAKRRQKAKLERSIEFRPAYIEKRATIGHFEGDTVVGKAHSGRMATITERKTGYLLAKLIHNEPASVRALPIDEQEVLRLTPALKFADYTSSLLTSQIKPKYLKTLTLDNGSEMAGFEWIERQTVSPVRPAGIKVYFANAYHSWERGTNENTNGLLRFYFPKQMSFANLTDEELDKVVKEINNRPRKRLNYRTPAEIMRRNGVTVGGGM